MVMLEVQGPRQTHPAPIQNYPKWARILDSMIKMPPPVNSRENTQHRRGGYHQEISVSGALTKPRIVLWGTTKPSSERICICEISVPEKAKDRHQNLSTAEESPKGRWITKEYPRLEWLTKELSEE